jgi:hypothetical protein
VGVWFRFEEPVGGDLDRERAAVMMGLDERSGVGCVDRFDAEARGSERRPRGQVGCAFAGVPLAGDGQVEPGRCERGHWRETPGRGSGGNGIDEVPVKRGIVEIRPEEGAPAVSSAAMILSVNS